MEVSDFVNDDIVHPLPGGGSPSVCVSLHKIVGDAYGSGLLDGTLIVVSDCDDGIGEVPMPPFNSSQCLLVLSGG